jgi:hypothetical protein
MQINPKTTSDTEVLSIWRDAYTSKAFLAGLPDSVGQVLVPTSKNIQDLAKESRPRPMCLEPSLN